MYQRLSNWTEKPYLIHWAGTPVTNYDGLNRYIFQFLNEAEKVKFPLSIAKSNYDFSSVKIKLKKIYNIISHK